MSRRPRVKITFWAGLAPALAPAMAVAMVGILALWPGEARAPGGGPRRPGTSASAGSTAGAGNVATGTTPTEGATSHTRGPEDGLALRTTPTVRAVRRVGPAVVAILSTRAPKENPYTDTPWGSYYKPHKEERSFSLGSGVIVDRRGFVLTNEHVVSQATEITVRLASGERLSATIVGASPSLDLAVLKLQTSRSLPAATLGDSATLLHGEPAIAIGTPYGLTQTVSQGVVSATRRSLQAKRRSYVDFIQTDASIHPGNSGGPLVNILGEVIGINTATLSDGPGIGLAIPVNVARQVMGDIMRHGRVSFPWLGIAVANLPQDGVRVTHVAQGSPAAAAGVRPGDVISELHDQEVKSEIDYWRILRALVPGTRVTLRLSRGLVTMKVSGSPIAPPALGNVRFEVRLGVTLGNAAEHADRLKLDYRRGAVILHAVPGGSAYGRNLRTGDVIVGLEANPVKSVADLNHIAKSLRPGTNIHLIVARGRRLFPFMIKY